MNLLSALQRLSRRRILLTGALLIAVTSWVDYATGPELSVSVFYFLPIALLAGFHGLHAGVAASIISALLWMLAEQLPGAGRAELPVIFWNTVVRLLANLTITFALTLLRESLRTRRDLTGFIIHDLRSPLSNILMGQHLLLMSNRLDENDKDLVQASIESCQRMTMLINSILDLEKLENGKMPVESQDLRVQTLVDSAITQVLSLAADIGVQLQVDVAAGASTVRADAELTKRVLVNLLDNALKYSPPDSVVTVRAARTAPNTVTVTVRDQGPGIPQAQKKHIFDKFVQVESSGGAARRGSGLGLAFCRLAVEAQGGRIWLDSQAGQGAVVSFTLPALSDPP